MANDEDDLRINTMHQLTKHSPRAILEEHGSCEVPAGCGGVVLRWRDPSEGRPGVLQVVCTVAVRTWLDGEEQVNSWVTLPAGRHVIAIEARDLEGPAPIIVRITPGEADADDDHRPLVASHVGSAWRSAAAPPDGWTAPDFDDRDWAFARSGARLVLSQEQDTDYAFRRFHSLIQRGAHVLCLEGSVAALRGTFTVEASS